MTRRPNAIEHLLEDAPVGVVLVDPRCRIHWINAAAAEMFAVDRLALIGMDKRDLVRTLVPWMVSNAEEVAAHLLAGLEGVENGPVESHLMPGDGRRERWIEHALHPLKIGPLAGGWIEFCTDITDRKRAEADAGHLELAVEDQRMILENMAGFTYRHDAEGFFHYVSPSVERVTGYAPEEWMKHYTAYLTDEPNNRKVVEHTEETLRTGQTSPPYRVEIFHRSGSRVMLEVSERAYFEEGRVAGIVGIAFDITDQLRLESRVQHVQKLESMGVLAGGIAHDFNNLLMAIQGNAALALDTVIAGSPAEEHLQEILLTSRRAADLCQQMLAYSGKGTMRLEPIDLSALVEEMASMLEVSISKKVRLVYDFAPDLPAALGDPTQVRQVVLNLITNASEAIGDEPGEVRVRTGAAEMTRAELKAGLSAADPIPGTYAWLEVEDTGAGMDQETLAMIFDPFFTTKFTGRGLGLSTVLGILRGHEGAIRIWSDPGRGTRFRVLFPTTSLAPAPAPRSAETRAGPRAGPRPATGLALVVDDEPAVRKVGRRMLEKLGYEVVTADHGRAGLDLFRARQGEIVLCLLDMTMPEMNGDEVFRAMRSIAPDVNVILTSGFDEGETSKRMGKGVRYRFLQKPFGQEALAAAIGELLGGT